METKAGMMVREARIKKNWSQAELADKINKSAALINGMEKGDKPILKPNAEQFIELFGFDSESFLKLCFVEKMQYDLENEYKRGIFEYKSHPDIVSLINAIKGMNENFLIVQR